MPLRRKVVVNRCTTLRHPNAPDVNRILLASCLQDQIQGLRTLEVGVGDVHQSALVEIHLDILSVAEDPELRRLAPISRPAHVVIADLHLSATTTEEPG